jgi:hypothetical protein
MMTQVYVDKYGFLWVSYIAAVPHDIVWVLEHSGDQHVFNRPKDVCRFRHMLGFEFLGEL